MWSGRKRVGVDMETGAWEERWASEGAGDPDEY